MPSPLQWRSDEARQIIEEAARGSRIAVLYANAKRKYPVMEIFPTDAAGCFAVHLRSIKFSKSKMENEHEDRAHGAHSPIGFAEDGGLKYVECFFMLDGSNMGYRAAYEDAEGTHDEPNPLCGRMVYVAKDKGIRLDKLYLAALTGERHLEKLLDTL